MNVPRLQTSAGIPGLQPVQSFVPALWGAIDSASGYLVNFRFRVQHPAKGCASGMDGNGAQRSRDQAASEGADSDWPGRDYGIRKPYSGETALSWAEVIHALNHNDIRDALKAQA